MMVIGLKSLFDKVLIIEKNLFESSTQNFLLKDFLQFIQNTTENKTMIESLINDMSQLLMKIADDDPQQNFRNILNQTHSFWQIIMLSSSFAKLVEE